MNSTPPETRRAFTLPLGSRAFEGPYDFRSRMGEGNGTTRKSCSAPPMPGASRALALQLTNVGFTVKRIRTTAKVDFEERDGGWSIHRIDLATEASVSYVAASQRRPSRNRRRAPSRTARSREPCPASTSICEPNSSEFQHKRLRGSTPPTQNRVVSLIQRLPRFRRSKLN
jgi:hypothetical protein